MSFYLLFFRSAAKLDLDPLAKEQLDIMNPLIIGIKRHQIDKRVVKHFIDRGLDVDARNKYGATLLIAAAGSIDNKHCCDITAYLLETGAQVNLRDHDGHSALHWASWRDNSEVLTLLLDAGAEVDAVTHEGLTALMLAAQQGYTTVVNLLIQANADVNLVTNEGFTALMGAAITNDHAIAKILMQAKADVNIVKNSGETALELASTYGRHYTASVLLNECANPQYTPNYSFALHLGIMKKNFEIVEKLLKYGADPQEYDVLLSGCNALDIAKLTNEPTIINLVENAKRIRKRYLQNQKKKRNRRCHKISAEQIVCGQGDTPSVMSVKEEQHQEARDNFLNVVSSAAAPMTNMANSIGTRPRNSTDNLESIKSMYLENDIRPGMYDGWWESDDDTEGIL